MATITFWGNVGVNQGVSGINHGAGSGLGFYGNGYGLSVPVGRYQDTTFITNADGTAPSNQAIGLNNTKYIHANSGQTMSGPMPLSGIPNYQTPLNIRFTHDEAVAVQTCKLWIFDRKSILKNASGVTTEVYEARKPNPTVGAPSLKKNVGNINEWETFLSIPNAQPPELILTNSPGMSGLNAEADEVLSSGDGVNWLTKQGAAHRSTRHDWYIAISATPDGIGSKTDYGLYFTCEYL